jgi:hypothetical protein
MRHDDIMKADLLSEIVLLSSGVVIVISLLMVIVVLSRRWQARKLAGLSCPDSPRG